MESDIELIKAIQQNPALYDPSNRDFKYMMRKEEIWQDVASYLGISEYIYLLEHERSQKLSQTFSSCGRFEEAVDVFEGQIH